MERRAIGVGGGGLQGDSVRILDDIASRESSYRVGTT